MFGLEKLATKERGRFTSFLEKRSKLAREFETCWNANRGALDKWTKGIRGGYDDKKLGLAFEEAKDAGWDQDERGYMDFKAQHALTAAREGACPVPLTARLAASEDARVHFRESA